MSNNNEEKINIKENIIEKIELFKTPFSLIEYLKDIDFVLSIYNYSYTSPETGITTLDDSKLFVFTNFNKSTGSVNWFQFPSNDFSVTLYFFGAFEYDIINQNNLKDFPGLKYNLLYSHSEDNSIYKEGKIYPSTIQQCSRLAHQTFIDFRLKDFKTAQEHNSALANSILEDVKSHEIQIYSNIYQLSDLSKDRILQHMSEKNEVLSKCQSKLSQESDQTTIFNLLTEYIDVIKSKDFQSSLNDENDNLEPDTQLYDMVL
jgi:hypothetical protein